MSLNEVDFVDEKKIQRKNYYEIDPTGKLIFLDENGNPIEEKAQ